MVVNTVNHFAKSLCYITIKNICKIFNVLYFHRVVIYGKENIPKHSGIIYCANHCNGFLDALLLGAYTPRKVISLTRSDVFNKRFSWFLSAIGMLPIYRMRDGYEKLSKNHDVFAQCRAMLGHKASIIMFPEAGQNLNRYLKPLSKGSSRLALESQKDYQSTNIYLQPVGLNYSHLSAPRGTVHLVFGKPILIRGFLSETPKTPIIINELKNTLTHEIKKCLWLPEIEEGFEHQWRFVDNQSAGAPFQQLKKELPFLAKKTPPKMKSTLFIQLLEVPNWIVFQILKKVLSFFNTQLFHNSMKYAFGAIIFPLYWVIMVLTLWFVTGLWMALIFLIICVGSLFLRQSLMAK